MKKAFSILFPLLAGLFLSACGSSAGPTPAATATPSEPGSPTTSLTRTNDEALVTVAITPLNLDEASASALTFKVVFDTHSVDLNYDLARLATLSSSTGEIVEPKTWTGAPGGGHHKEGVLAFPQLKNRGQTLTLTLRGIADVPERTFTWKVN